MDFIFMLVYLSIPDWSAKREKKDIMSLQGYILVVQEAIWVWMVVDVG